MLSTTSELLDTYSSCRPLRGDPMSIEGFKRKLTAILSADVKGTVASWGE